MSTQLELNFRQLPPPEVIPGLNAAQRAAVMHLGGPMLVVAGAGTGKTRVLEERIARLVRTSAARPREIVAVTYTRKAAAELRGRLQQRLTATQAREVRCSTFHSFCYRILLDHGATFQLLEAEELWVYLRQRIEELPLRRFLKAANPARFLNDLVKFFDRCNDELVSAADYAKYVERVRCGDAAAPRVHQSKQAADVRLEEVVGRCEEIAAVFAQVERMLVRDNLGSYGSLVAQTVARLRDDSALLRQQQSGIRYILVDEFQDTNHAQIELLRLISAEERNVFAVGDPDQAIYRFRGASSGAFEEFLKVFPGTALQALAENYRSTQKILDCSHSIIRRNPEIEGNEYTRTLDLRRRPLRAAGREQAKTLPVEIVPVTTAEEEAADIAETILREHRVAGLPWNAFAVLYRTHFHRNPLTRVLAAYSIPFSVKGVNVFQTDAVRDCMALLRCLDVRENSTAWFRAALMPRFGIDTAELQQRLGQAPHGAGVRQTLLTFAAGERFVMELTRAQEELLPLANSAPEVLAGCIRLFGLDGDGIGLRQLTRFVKHWEQRPLANGGRLKEFLEFVELWQQAGGILDAENPLSEDESALSRFYEEPDGVRLITVHAAKGLEYDRCLVIRVAQSSFPAPWKESLFEFPAALRKSHRNAMAGDAEGGDKEDKRIHSEEERRLFYVAITRARHALSLYGKVRGKAPLPGVYLKQLGEDTTIQSARIVRSPIAVTLPASATETPLPQWAELSPRAGLATEPLSASAIDTYERCPLQFKLMRDWRLPGEVTAALQYGNVVHQALQNFNESIRQGRPKNPAQVIEVFSTSLAGAGIADRQQFDLYLKQGTEDLTRYVERADLNANILAAEKKFCIEVNGIGIRGRIDRMDALGGNRIAIVDYKTGAAKLQSEADISLQLSIYALAARELGQVADRLIFFNLSENTAIESHRDEEDLAEAEERIGTAAENIAAGNFAPKPGRFCSWCSFRDLCPATAETVYSGAKIQTGVGAN